jgi:biopolymer transport protein ExbB
MSLLELLKSGGATLYILVLCSMFSLGIIIERFIYYRVRSKIRRVDFMSSVRKVLSSGKAKQAIEICHKNDTPFSKVVQMGLNFYGHNEVVISNAMEREITIETRKLERHTSIVGTIGSTAVYIGLFGTVMGIIRAFNDIADAGLGGINVVIRGISEALICTAAGLAVAVPAVIAYNYFMKKIDQFITDMELCASETMDLLTIPHETPRT